MGVGVFCKVSDCIEFVFSKLLNEGIVIIEFVVFVIVYVLFFVDLIFDDFRFGERGVEVVVWIEWRFCIWRLIIIVVENWKGKVLKVRLMVLY